MFLKTKGGDGSGFALKPWKDNFDTDAAGHSDARNYRPSFRENRVLYIRAQVFVGTKTAVKVICSENGT